MKHIPLYLGLIIPTLGLTAAPSVTGDHSAPAPACRIAVRAHVPANAVGSDKIVLHLRGTSQVYSRVKIRGGSWSRMGNSADIHQVIFHPDGSWEERVGDSPGKGKGTWTGGYTLNLGCRFNRRYEFKMSRERAGGGVTTLAPVYPSSNTWTRNQTIDLGNLARYF